MTDDNSFDSPATLIESPAHWDSQPLYDGGAAGDVPHRLVDDFTERAIEDAFRSGIARAVLAAESVAAEEDAAGEPAVAIGARLAARQARRMMPRQNANFPSSDAQHSVIIRMQHERMRYHLDQALNGKIDDVWRALAKDMVKAYMPKNGGKL